jgi:hypothetical protein
VSHPPSDADRPPLEQGWWSPAARRLHLTLAIGLPGCMAAGWFELSRALAGREIAWVYAGEWPLYGVIGTYLWWKLLHSDGAVRLPAPGESNSPSRRTATEGVPNDDAAVVERTVSVPDLELKAWQNYVNRLHELDPPGEPPPRR